MREVRLLHSSDLHVEDAGPHAPPRGDVAGIAGLAAVLAAARELRADVVLLAGDTFDHVRIGDATLARATALIAAAGMPVVLLPGNHDPTLPDCLYRRAGLLELPQVTVLGVNARSAVFEDLGLEVWGEAHRGEDALEPLGLPPPRRTSWQVAMAHGHYVPPGEHRWHSHRAWRIGDDALREACADYVALGHWDRAARVGPAEIEAHYSGSPDFAGSVQIASLASEGVSVRRHVLCRGKGG
jgi:DNA repair exonuclease SbcCD nuclease subunit